MKSFVCSDRLVWRVRRPALAFIAAVVAVGMAAPAAAQQRPLATEDPEPIGAGRLLVEAGLEFAHDQEYPASGLEGNLLRVPTLGLSFGISSIAEFQIDGVGFNRLSITHRHAAPLSSMLTVTGDSTHDVEDIVVATKIRLKAEGPRHPSLAVRFATKLPNARNETGLGLDTTDFSMAILGAKTTQSIRVAANLGMAILGNPTDGSQQNDVLIYGLSLARALTDHAEVVGEINGRASVRAGDPAPGTESRGLLAVGARYTQGSVRLDAAFFFGLSPTSPTIGFATGMTFVFRAFDVP